MNAEPQITQAEMDKYFETGGKEAPVALQEAEKVEKEQEKQQLETDVSRETKPVDTKLTETKATEKPAETKPEDAVQVNVEGKMVPLAELMAERKNRQAWEQTAAQQQQQLTEALKLAQERAKLVPESEQAKAPDPNQDPQGYAVWEYEQYKKSVAELNQWRQEQAKLQDANTRTQQVLGWAQTQTTAFKEKTPDYDDAYKFASDSLNKELDALGYSDPNVRQQIIAQRQAEAIGIALQTGRNPAEVVYNYAKARGYKAEIVAEQKKVPQLDDQLKTIQKGQEAAKGVSQGSGGAPSEINSLADLAAASGDMDDEEFSKAFDKLKPKMKGKYV